MSTETTNKKIKIDNGTTFGKTYTDKAIDAKLPTDLIASANKLSLGVGNSVLGNGVNLVAEKSTDPSFPKEIYVGLCTDEDVWIQDLAIIRQKYEIKDDKANYIDEILQVLVYADDKSEDYTNIFEIKEVHQTSL